MVSITYGANYMKLKTNLSLAINRLKMQCKKRTELNLKARVDIAQLLEDQKDDRARIRVEHVIREDFTVEACEILELYCDLLLARYGIIEHRKELDDSIGEAVVSLLWAVPRMANDIPEFKVIGDQLTMKYGKGLAQAAILNKVESPAVNQRLIEKMSITTPKKILVERYLIAIAHKAGVKFKPDPEIVQEDEVSLAEKMLIEFCGAGKGSAPMPPYPSNSAPEVGWTTLPPHHFSIPNPNYSSTPDSSMFSTPSPRISPPKPVERSIPAPPKVQQDSFDQIRNLPEPPKSQNDPDFDELMKRFDALKKRN